MTIILNGNEKELPDGANVGYLVAELKLTPSHIAVELNKNLLPRARYGETVLRPQDQVEIVTLVGGG